MHPLNKGKHKGIGFTSDIQLTVIYPTLQGFPNSACHSHLPGEDTALVKPQLIVLTRLLSNYYTIARCQCIYHSQIRGMKGLQIEPGIECWSLSQESETLTTKGAVIIYGWGGRCKSENRVHSKFAPPLTTAHSKFAPPPRKQCTEIFIPLVVCQPCIYISRYDVSQW